MSDNNTVRREPSIRFGAVLATISAVALTTASAATNVTSAVSRYPDMSAKIIAGTIAGAVAVLVSLSLAATLRALARRQFATALICAAAFLMAGAFSITAALGTLGGARLTASLSTAHAEADRARLTSERQKAADELATIMPARSVEELTPEIARILATPKINGCVEIDGPVTKQWCPVLTALQSELARAQRRASLQGTVIGLDAKLARIGAPTLANPDAETLAHVLGALGAPVSADRINVALMILAVAVLEVGGGLALAIARALSPAGSARAHARIVLKTQDKIEAPSTVPTVATVQRLQQAAVAVGLPSPGKMRLTAAATPCNTTTRDKVLALIVEAGGTVRADQRSVAKALGVASSTVNRAIAALQADGIITKRASSTGSVLVLRTSSTGSVVALV